MKAQRDKQKSFSPNSLEKEAEQERKCKTSVSMSLKWNITSSYHLKCTTISDCQPPLLYWMISTCEMFLCSWGNILSRRKRKSSPSLSIKSCRALKEPDCRGSWGSSWSFCNIRYTSESSMLVRVLGLSNAHAHKHTHTRTHTIPCHHLIFI